jgi:hypothetical protein
MGIFFYILIFSIGAGMILLFRKYSKKEDKE